MPQIRGFSTAIPGVDSVAGSTLSATTRRTAGRSIIRAIRPWRWDADAADREMSVERNDNAQRLVDICFSGVFGNQPCAQRYRHFIHGARNEVRQTHAIHDSGRRFEDSDTHLGTEYRGNRYSVKLSH